MEHTDFCRQMEQQGVIVDAAKASQKFLLPMGGQLIDDPDLRAIDEMQELRLPFPVVALEFFMNQGGPATVIFASEHHDRIKIATCFRPIDKWLDSGSTSWIPKTGYMDRSIRGEYKYPGLISFEEFENGEVLRHTGTENHVWSRVLLSFLNALACSNVRIDRSEPRKPGKKIKSALPFDSYHVLTIDVPGRIGSTCGAGTSHRSPREHVRRGHIRRLESGRSIWINDTVVAAGKGAGIVKKDYALRVVT